jgi:hypothetical protein
MADQAVAAGEQNALTVVGGSVGFDWSGSLLRSGGVHGI